MDTLRVPGSQLVDPLLQYFPMRVSEAAIDSNITGHGCGSALQQFASAGSNISRLDENLAKITSLYELIVPGTQHGLRWVSKLAIVAADALPNRM